MTGASLRHHGERERARINAELAERARLHAEHHAAQVAADAVEVEPEVQPQVSRDVSRDAALGRLRAALVQARAAVIDLRALNHPTGAALNILTNIAEQFGTTSSN